MEGDPVGRYLSLLSLIITVQDRVDRIVSTAKNVLLVGGGIVGLATAFKILRAAPDSTVSVLEKEDAVGKHQSGRNSGVLHAGLYYRPGSLKARLAVEGIKQMVEFCREHGVAHDVCGKLVVAQDEEEIVHLKLLREQGTKNGLRDLALLSQEQMLELEPHVGGLAALHVPEEGIVDYGRVCSVLVQQIEEMGGRVVTGTRVKHLRSDGSGWIARTSMGEFEGSHLITCAGLQADLVSEIAGEKRELRIIPFRGEFYQLKAASQHLVNNLIYPVPRPGFPFLGVHCTRLINGGVEVGPNAVLATAREGYSRTDVNISEALDALGFPGLWRFMYRHRKLCAFELSLSLSKRRFCWALMRLIPSLKVSDLEPGHRGVRAQAMTATGELVYDFTLIERARALHLLNAPSPAATASLAIGAEIARRLLHC